MKKRFIPVLLAAAVVMNFTACGSKEPAGTTAAQTFAAPAASASADASTTAAAETESFVEETAPARELDKSSPIPADTGTLTLTEQVFETENLRLKLPPDVKVEYEEPTQSYGHITVLSEDGAWKLLFRPFKTGGSYNTVVNNVDSTMIYADNPIKTDWSRDVSQKLAGFPARVWANNIREGWLHPSNEQDAPAVDIVVDYGETLAGPWYGMYIRLEAQEPVKDTNIYDLLYLRHVRAVLNNFEVITTPDGVKHSSGGITATFPARWSVKEGTNSLVTSFNSQALSGGVTFLISSGADPEKLANSWNGEKVTKTYNGRDYYGVITENKSGSGENAVTSYHMNLYSAFNDKRCFQVGVGLRDFKPEDLKNFLDNEQFVSVMNSVELDPDGYQEPGKASAEGLTSDRGSISSYKGTAEELEIPAEIGEYSTVYIGGNAFKGNMTLKSVVIPEGVTWIQGSAFEGCQNLEKVVLPDTLLEIGPNAFRNCPNLTDIVLPQSVCQVGSSAFAESGKGSFTGSPAVYDRRCFAESTFETISLPAGSDISADNMFRETKASSVELPSDLEVLGDDAFVNTENIHEIRLPDTLKVIGKDAFINMRGLMRLNLPEGIEELPENMTSSTTTDVIVIPKSVKKIGSYAIFDANIVVIQNPEVEIDRNGITASYIVLEDAKNFEFPSGGEVLRGSRLYLDGIYDPSEIKGDFYNGTAISDQVYLPMDATTEESDELDKFLVSVGYEEIAWISGSSKDFVPDSTYDFDSDKNQITGYHGNSKKLCIPDYVMQTDGTFWYTSNVYSIADEAFAGKGFVSAFFKGNLGDGTGARILKDNPDLADIWFNMQVLPDSEKNYYNKEAFAGVPENVTVHLPASLTDQQRKQVEDFLHGIGIPAGAAFDYYGIREAAAKTAANETAAAETTAAGTAGSTDASGKTASGEPYINDGKTEGLYSLYSFLGMSIFDVAEMSGTSAEEASKMIQINVKGDGTAEFISQGEEPAATTFTIDGEKVTMEAEGEKVEGTLKDGLLTLAFEGEEMVFARLTEAAFEAPDKGEVTVWKGTYTKLVGDSDDTKNTDEEFSLDLYEDGTGVHHRSGMDFNVTWELKGEEFTMSETFIGSPIVYTGTMSGNTLHLYNGDPTNDFTYEYFYEN
ncbi:MAG: leucine-rich repeat domain-containing protein [Stomatobaculum sp.]|nr:leucine-rich repeat domain-containing protein [Stomatobaculum sp.]